MAQTTGSKAKSSFKAEVSINGSSWSDISGSATQVTPSGGDQLTGVTHVASDNAPIVTNGNKVDAITLEVNIVYTEVTGEAWQIVGDRYVGTDKTVYFRYSPKGGATGQKRYTCANDAGQAIAVPIVNCIPPEGDANSGDPLTTTFTLLTPKFLIETIGT
jgi:hypothetical protein